MSSVEPVEGEWNVGGMSLKLVDDPSIEITVIEPEVEQEDVVEEFPDVVPEDAQPEEEVNYRNTAIQLAFNIRQILESGDSIAYVIVNPAYTQGLQAAIMELPDDAFPQQWKENVMLAESDQLDGIQIVKNSDIERQFLEKYFGPREMGGTGLIPALANYLNSINCPVRITKEFLHFRFLAEAETRCVPQIITPTGAELRRGIPIR